MTNDYKDEVSTAHLPEAENPSQAQVSNTYKRYQVKQYVPGMRAQISTSPVNFKELFKDIEPPKFEK
jgi:hypothetical protein